MYQPPTEDEAKALKEALNYFSKNHSFMQVMRSPNMGMTKGDALIMTMYTNSRLEKLIEMLADDPEEALSSLPKPYEMLQYTLQRLIHESRRKDPEIILDDDTQDIDEEKDVDLDALADLDPDEETTTVEEEPAPPRRKKKKKTTSSSSPRRKKKTSRRKRR